MTRGLIVGKFYPPHAGHHFLIDHALERCDELVVVIAGSHVESVPLPLRREWLEERHPTAVVRATYDDHPIDYDDPRVWARHVDVFLAAARDPIDVVFTSEPYGDELGRRLNARHESVDPERHQVPVSGRALRADIAAHWEFLSPAVRGYFAKRVVLVGAESTGTTTMARGLAEHFRTTWAPEVGWRVSERKLREGTFDNWSHAEFAEIARQQHADIEVAARTGGPVVFSDTDALATCIWEERYLNTAGGETEKIAARHPPELYLLTSDVGVAFEAHPLRDGEAIRPWMTKRFRERLNAQPVPWVELTGSLRERTATAVARVERLLTAGWQFAPTLEERNAYSRTK